MAGISDYLEDSFLAVLFKQTAFITAPTTLFYSLHSADPGDTGANELDNGTSPGYARAELDPDPDTSTNVNYSVFIPSGGTLTINNITPIIWPSALNFWNGGNPVGYFACWDALTLGNCLFSGTVNGGLGVTVFAGQTVVCNGGNFTASVD